MRTPPTSYNRAMPLAAFIGLVGRTLFGARYGDPRDNRDQQRELTELLLHFLATGALKACARLEIPEQRHRARRNSIEDNVLPSVSGDWTILPEFWLGERGGRSLETGSAMALPRDFAPRKATTSALARSIRVRAGLPPSSQSKMFLADMRPDIASLAEVPIWVREPRTQLRRLALLPVPSEDVIRPRYRYDKLQTYEIVAAAWRYLAITGDRDPKGRPGRTAKAVQAYLLSQGFDEPRDKPFNENKRVQVIVRNVLRQLDEGHLSPSVWVATRPEAATQKSKK